MKEIHEFRIFNNYYHLLDQQNNAIFNGLVYVLKISKEDPLFLQLGKLDKEFRKKGIYIFSSWKVRRTYTKKELSNAKIFHFNIITAFEPTGEECGTTYDESSECEICGANRKQIGALKLKKGSIPKKDIARTISGEVIVSEKFVEVFKQKKLKGTFFEPVLFWKGSSNYFQLKSNSPNLELTDKTVVGHHPFNLSNETAEAEEFAISGGQKVKFEKTVFKCPLGHTIGARLVSEAYILSSLAINNFDFFISKQMIGAKQGLLRPEPLYFCSPAFRNMVEEEKLSGFEFEIANIE